MALRENAREEVERRRLGTGDSILFACEIKQDLCFRQ